MAHRILLCFTHHVCRLVVVDLHCKVLGIEEVVPEFFADWPLQGQELELAAVQLIVSLGLCQYPGPTPNYPLFPLLSLVDNRP